MSKRLLKRQYFVELCAMTLLCVGLVHCSGDPAPTQEQASNGGMPTAGMAGGSVVPAAGTSSETGGQGVAGNALGGVGGTAVGAGGASGATMSGSGGVPTEGSGGIGGSGGTAGGPAGGGSGSCSGDAIVCEDFEGYPTASAPAGGWTAALRGEGKILVDTTRAFGGKQALHVTGRMNKDHANISRPIQTQSPTAYVRFMYYPTSYPASSGVHTRLARLGTAQAATGNPYTSYSLASYNGIAIERVNSIYLRDTSTKLNDAKLLNRWSCLEFGLDMSGGVGKVKVQIWVDGRELTLSPAGSSSHGQTSSSWDPLALEVFMLGLDGYQDDTQPADYWIDDVLVTPQRVGCKAAAM